MRLISKARDAASTMDIQRALCIAAIAAGAIWAGTATLSFVNRDTSALDQENARRTIEAILTERNDVLRLRLVAAAEAIALDAGTVQASGRDLASQRLRLGIGRLDGLGGAFILAADDQVVAGFVDSQPATQQHLRSWYPVLSAALREVRGSQPAPAPSNGAIGDRPHLGLVTDGRSLVSAVASTLHLRGETAGGGDARGLVAVAFREYSTRDLSVFGDSLGVANLRFVAGLPGAEAAGIAVPTKDGTPGGYLAWDQSRPGATLVAVILLLVQLAGGFGMLSFGVAGWRHAVRHPASATRALVMRSGIDPVTELPTRAALPQLLAYELERARRNGHKVALLMIQLPDLARVRERYGRTGADAVLAAFAQRIDRIMRSADTLLRVEEDRFAIVQTGVISVTDVHSVARRILDKMVDDLPLAEEPLRIHPIIGIALWPNDANNANELIASAAVALERGTSGKRRHPVAYFDERLDATQRTRSAIEDDLRAAILDNQLSLVFQPIYQANGETMTGVETLVRWTHPDKGPVSPAEFVPIAEERGLIDALGDWVLRHALMEARRWPGLMVAVNVSPIQFRRPGFVERVLQIVSETNFEPWRLELEITEGVIIDDADAAEQAMMDLRAAGIRLALDDFGTGYSSLIYLRRFAFDKIKIDKSFLDAMETTGESAILVHSVIHLGRALGLTVTAEGVETPEQHRFLQAAGCHQMQGYLFSKPVPGTAIDEKLATQPAEEALPRAALGGLR